MVPLADVLGNFLNGIFTVGPAGITVAVALIDHGLQVVEQRLDVGLFFLFDDRLDTRDDVSHVVL